MPYQVILLFIVAVLNSFFSYFILGKEKTSINKLFSIITIAVAFWALFLGLFINTRDLSYAIWFANIYYISAAIIPPAFFYFSLLFKTDKKELSKKHAIFLLPLAVFVFGLIINKNFLLEKVFFSDFGKDVVFNKNIYSLYILYFIFFVLISYYNLVKTYLKTRDKYEKIQFKFIFFGTTISYILGMVFNLFLPWKDYSLIWLGPIFTLIMVISLGYAIIKHHLFDIKVIATEILIFILWIFILLRTILADTVEDQLINGGLLVMIIVLGIFLIRSVIKEVETREKIEKLAKDLENANIKLENANVKLKELDRQKSEFLSIASHQFRSPLSAIKGYTSLILEGSYGEIKNEIKLPIKNIFDSTNNLAMIVEDFLNVSRIEQGRMEYKFEKAKINEIIENVINEMKPSIDSSGLEFSFNYDKNVEYDAKVDVGKFKQVIANLIDNGLKYTKSGWLKLELKKLENKKILFSLSDSGVGILKQELSGLFTLFKRAGNANKVDVKGTGLGLYIVKKIIEAHNGRAWAESDGEGKGAEFYVELQSSK